MLSIRWMLVALVSLVPASSALAATADHQHCFKIKDDAAATAYTADLDPADGAFPVAAGCEVKARAKLLCIDVEKTNVVPAPPGADEGLPAQKSLCYKVKCPAPASPITVSETDQFGVHGIEVKKSFLLCAPIPEATSGCMTAGDCSPLANATVACSAGACVIGSCDAGYLDCDATASTGCEVGSQTDTSNCGACGLTCPLPANATAACVSGICTIGSCNPGYLDCDSNAGTGCEVDPQTDPSHCGGCNMPCPAPPNATAQCAAGICTIGSCDPGYLDCDSSPGTGCEVYTQNDPNNCGGCALSCPAPPNATAGCAAGICTIGSCDPGYLDCDSSSGTGCEVDSQTDPNNCGGCNVVCPGMAPNCSGGACF